MNPIYYSFLFDFDITSKFTYTSIIEVPFAIKFDLTVTEVIRGEEAYQNLLINRGTVRDH
jgi:hypothetical protein